MINYLVLWELLGPGSHLFSLRQDQDCEEGSLARHQHRSPGLDILWSHGRVSWR